LQLILNGAWTPLFFPWANDSALLGTWCRGMTGYPIVDAGMRELWTAPVCWMI
jgi:deoxyribodipyrimidine photolyase